MESNNIGLYNWAGEKKDPGDPRKGALGKSLRKGRLGKQRQENGKKKHQNSIAG